jgi:hypothetical protein
MKPNGWRALAAALVPAVRELWSTLRESRESASAQESLARALRRSADACERLAPGSAEIRERLEGYERELSRRVASIIASRDFHGHGGEDFAIWREELFREVAEFEQVSRGFTAEVDQWIATLDPHRTRSE